MQTGTVPGARLHRTPQAQIAIVSESQLLTPPSLPGSDFGLARIVMQIVIASAAKQSSFARSDEAGLLRCARNDDGGEQSLFNLLP